MITLAVQGLPLLVLIGLLASGRAGAVVACLGAIVAAVPAVWLVAPQLTDIASFFAGVLPRALWLALPPVGIVTGGLLFHAAVRRDASASPPADMTNSLFTIAFFLGPFAESVTGFGIGAVFSIGALRGAGLIGPPAAVIGLLGEALIPWGGLGPGSALGAVLADVPPQPMLTFNAFEGAVFWVGLLPLFWRCADAAGHPIPTAVRLGQVAWVMAAGILLIASHFILPWEVAGIVATGPLLAVRLLRANPPQSRADWDRAWSAAGPYLLLVIALLLARAWSSAPALRPFADLPAIAVDHVMVVLWLVAAGLLLAKRDWRSRSIAALSRARRPAVTILLYVCLARVLFTAGIPAALARALVDAFGSASTYASPLLAGLSGFVAGTNVGSNSMVMPMQAALGRLQALHPILLPAVQNFTGSAVMILSPQATSVFGPLAGATPRGMWALGWPLFPWAIAVGFASVVLG